MGFKAEKKDGYDRGKKKKKNSLTSKKTMLLM